MRKLLFLPFVILGLLLAQNSRSQGAQKPAGAGNSVVFGRWIINADFYGTPINFSLELKQEGDKLTGNFEGDKLEGTLTGNSIHFLAKDTQGGTEECQGTVQDGTMFGTVVFTDAGDAAHPTTYQFTAKLVPQRRAGAPQQHEFTPTTFYRQFSATNTPVLTISPGDTVHTTTVDAGGTDEKGVTRVLGGNAQDQQRTLAVSNFGGEVIWRNGYSTSKQPSIVCTAPVGEPRAASPVPSHRDPLPVLRLCAQLVSA